MLARVGAGEEREGEVSFLLNWVSSSSHLCETRIHNYIQRYNIILIVILATEDSNL